MTRFEAAATVVVERTSPLERERREEVVETVISLAGDRGTLVQARELAALIGLGLRLSASAATGDSTRSMLRQGLALAGSVVLLIAATTALVAGSPRAGLVAAVALAGAAVVPSRVGAVVLSSIGAMLWLAVAPAGAVIAGAMLGALLVGVFGVRRAFVPRSLLLGAGPVVALHLALIAIAGASPATEATVALVALLAALGLLGLGWFDPRLAVVATAIFAWRFAALDLGSLAAELVDLGTDASLDALVVRVLAMMAGLLAAAEVTRRSLDRAASV